MITGIRAVIFDIYGTLLDAPPGRIRPDAAADPLLRRIIESFGFASPDSPTQALARLVDLHHQQSPHPYPEIDLRELWRELLDLPEDHVIEPLVTAVEATWHPFRWMPGAPEMLHRLHCRGLVLGLLSNAQVNALPSLLDRAALFNPCLTILSYRHGTAKPSPALFELMAERLKTLGIEPDETLMIGNDPLLDIAPAATIGFHTAHYVAGSECLRPGRCKPTFNLKHWDELFRS